VAFIGGIIPTVVLGTRNADWLRVEKKMTVLMIILGSVILFSKLLAVGLLAAGYIQFDIGTKAIKLIYRAACVLLYFGYYFLMRDKFNQHIMTGGEIQPMLKDAIIWSTVGAVVEGFFMVAEAGIIKGVF